MFPAQLRKEQNIVLAAKSDYAAFVAGEMLCLVLNAVPSGMVSLDGSRESHLNTNARGMQE